MKLFFINIIFFFFFFMIFSEIVSRVFHVSYNMPRIYKDTDGLIKFYPNQSGYYDGGKSKWYINELGLPGEKLPDSYDNLITIIGDSYIQNFMNPDSCRQSIFLKKRKPEYNFIEAAREGATLLEYFEIAKKLDSLNPRLQLIYVNSSDFKGCFSKNPYDVKLDTINNKIVYSKYNESKLKMFIPYLNFPEFLYRKYHGNLIRYTQGAKNKKKVNIDSDKSITTFNKGKYNLLLKFIKKNYKTKNIIIVFHPNIEIKFIDLVEKYEIKNYILEKSIDNWIRTGDIHWTCNAHFEIAKQVSVFLDEFSKNE